MKLSQLLNSLSKYIEFPEMFYLRRKGVTASQYTKYGQKWIQELKPETIFDIGANAGQSAVAFKALFPDANIYSFEPIPNCFEILKKRTEKMQNVHAFNIGLGDCTGEFEFELNDFSASSSFLPLAEAHKNLYNYATKTQPITVKVDKLDNFIERIEIKPPIMMKIDVQGFEDRVIIGGESLIKQSSILIIETSFKTLYLGQPLFEDIYQILHEWGFKYKGSVENMYDRNNDEIVQSDVVFTKID
jgi:FkbM family methyltransferase